MTLTEFLLLRIADDEALSNLDESTNHLASCRYVHDDAFCDCGHPARLRVERAAKRVIVGLHQSDTGVLDTYCRTCGDDDTDEPGRSFADWPCSTILALAVIYSGHVDYREEWRV